MKKILHLIHKPKHIAAIAITIALVVGIIGYVSINKSPAYQFAKAEAGTIQNAQVSNTMQNLTLGFLASGRVESVNVAVGDSVREGEVLAVLDPENTVGDLTEAKAAYASAVANYTKVQNGATSADVDVSNTALLHDEQSLAEALTNSLIAASNAVTNNTNALFNNPQSDDPTLDSTNIAFSNTDLENKIDTERSAINEMIPSWQGEFAGISTTSDLTTLAGDAQKNLQTIGAYLDDLNALFANFASAGSATQATFAADQASIVAAQASITAQVSALTMATQDVSSAEADLTLKTTSARPEDIAAAQAQVSNAEGAVQIAEAAYDDRIIAAPADGTVTAVYVTVGQIAEPNTPAIDLSANVSSKSVAIMIPNTAIIDQSGDTYVLVKAGNGTVERQIVTGASDATNTEVLSGLAVGDEVVIH